MPTLSERKRRFERRCIAKALAKLGSVSAAAKALGVNRTYLYRRIAVLGVPYEKKHRGSWRQQGL